MAQASRDENFVPTLLGVSNVDGTTPVKIYADPTTHRLLIDNAGSATLVVGTTAISNGTSGRVLYDNAGVLGEYTITGTGSVVMSNSPTFTDDITLGATGGATGSVLFKGTTSGTVTLSVADAAGTWTMKLPTSDGDAGQVLTTDGTGVTTWETPAGGGNVSNTGTPLDNQIAVWTSATVIEGTTGLTYDGANFQLTGDIGSTGTRITKGWFTDLQVTNTISGSITGNAATVTVADAGGDATTFVLLGTDATGSLSPRTDAGLTYDATTNILTSSGGFAGSITGNAATVTFANEATDTTCFVAFATAASGNLEPKTNANLTFNSNTGVLTSASSVLTTTDINGGTIDGVTIGGSSAGAITGTTITANTGFMPDANDGAYLGQSGTAFSDLFLADGGVINWNAGNATLTHSAGLLTSNVSLSLGTSNVLTTGTIELGAASDTTLARSAAGQVTIEGVQIVTTSNTVTMTNKTLQHTFEPASDDTFTGETLQGLNAGATIAQWDCVYLGSASKWLLTDADAATTAGGVMVAMATAAGTDTNPLTVILRGVVRNDGWTWATVGAPLYLDTATPGGMTLTAPSGTDDVVKIVGYVLSDDCIYFNPSNDWITRV